MTLPPALRRLLPRRPALPAEGRLVLVCAPCEARAGTPPLADELRAGLRTAGLASDTRVVEAGCLGLCPEGRVCVLAQDRCILVDPAHTREALRAALVDALAPR